MAGKGPAIAFGALLLGASGLVAFFARRRSPARQLGDASDDILSVAADAFLANDIKRGEKILDQLPENERAIARCIRAKKKQYIKGDGWKGWKQVSDYRLYKPLVADPLYASKGPFQYPYTNVTVAAEHNKTTTDGNTEWVTILGDLGPTESYPEGEYRFLKLDVHASTSHTKTLRKLGYRVIIPCNNVPLSGRH